MATALTLFTRPEDFEAREDDAPTTADIIALRADPSDAQPPENGRARRRARRDARRFAGRAPSSPFGLW